jgi:hypothetical protein
MIPSITLWGRITTYDCHENSVLYDPGTIEVDRTPNPEAGSVHPGSGVMPSIPQG